MVLLHLSSLKSINIFYNLKKLQLALQNVLSESRLRAVNPLTSSGSRVINHAGVGYVGKTKLTFSCPRF